MEAVGVVEAVGPGLTGRKVGDIVAYAGSPMGSYAKEHILPADKVVHVPPSFDPIVAAAVMSKGMTSQFLVRRCFKVVPGHTVLVHAAAGGVGSLLCQCANALGATVIGTVLTKEKAAEAKDDGCHHIILYKEEDFVTRVNEITSGKRVEVVYDSVGKDTFQGISIRLMTKPTSILDNTHLVILTTRQCRKLHPHNSSVLEYSIVRKLLCSGIVGMLKNSWVHDEFWAVFGYPRSSTFVRTCCEIPVNEAFSHAIHCET